MFKGRITWKGSCQYPKTVLCYETQPQTCRHSMVLNYVQIMYSWCKRDQQWQAKGWYVSTTKHIVNGISDGQSCEIFNKVSCFTEKITKFSLINVLIFIVTKIFILLRFMYIHIYNFLNVSKIFMRHCRGLCFCIAEVWRCKIFISCHLRRNLLNIGDDHDFIFE